MIGKVYGTGSCVPEHILDNQDLSQMVDTSDTWIRERTGVKRRHIIEEENVVSMAVSAARRALEKGNVRAAEVDLLIVSTFTSETLLPCAACEVQKHIGAMHATCFDLNAACTGFLFAYNMAQAYIMAGWSRTALLIGAESLSNMVNWEDRGTCILFGDGAGAVVLRAEQGEPQIPVTHSDGNSGQALTMLSRHRKGWLEGRCAAGTLEDADSFIQMNGREIFQFAVRKVPEVIWEVLNRNQWTPEQIDYFVLHQANQRIVESVARRLQTGIEKFPMNLQEYGNTSSASIPILLDEMNRDGRLKSGQRILIAGFGAGLSWGASVLEW